MSEMKAKRPLRRTVNVKITEDLHRNIQMKRETIQFGRNVSDLVRIMLEAWLEKDSKKKEEWITTLLFYLRM